MTAFTFTLVYQLAEDDCDHDVIVERFGEAGLTDFLVGLGQSGYLGLELEREGRSADAVLRAALSDAKRMLPEARLIEVGPDYVGLTGMAERLGMSRQNLRKLMVANASFPLPVHGGSASIWHAAEVLGWLRDGAGYAIGDQDIATAQAAWRANADIERGRMNRAGCTPT
jgi:predicted DNA-binding transcriptional regulator AlpA